MEKLYIPYFQKWRNYKHLISRNEEITKILFLEMEKENVSHVLGEMGEL